MNKMKATLMVAVMIFSMASVCIVGLSSEETSADASKIILGKSMNEPYYLDMGDTSGKDVSIEFNESAFSSGAIISFYEASSGTYYTVGGGAKNVGGVDVKITDSDTNARDGCYTVNFVGKSVSDSTVYIRIILSIVDIFDGQQLPTQTYVFDAYVKVVNNTGNKIVIAGDGVTASTGSVITYGLSFNYETDAKMTLNVNNESGQSVNGYVFYADGLPSGISVTRDGSGYLIGGKVAANYTTMSGNGTIYAVSQAGKVITQSFSWTIGGSNIGTMTIFVDGSEVSNGYVFRTVGDNVAVLTIGVNDTSKYKITGEATIAGGQPETISASGVELEIGSTDGKYDGTGVFTVTINATIEPATTSIIDVKTVNVTQTITVYVVSQIVDADLDPVVSSN